MELLVSLENHSYKIVIGDLPYLNFTGKKVGIITNPKVGGFHLAKLLEKIKADEVVIITIPDGEEYKNMESVQLILESLFNHRFNRKSLLIAFGGGVIGDITGFTSSIYQRGIDFIQIPTTLLSGVDASVGGKTGINNKWGKNLVGTFHQPKAVYLDTNFLKTLGKREFNSGVSEIIKMAIIFDNKFFNWLEEHDLNSDENLRFAISRSVELKAMVVSQDERENGLRASLNYGHTFGHIVEVEGNYSKYLHGEAVAIGIIMANMLAEKVEQISKTDSERVLLLLKKYNLPTTYKIKDVNNFYDKFWLDKKSSNKKITFILPLGIGDFKFRDDIDEKIIKAVLEKFA